MTKVGGAGLNLLSEIVKEEIFFPTPTIITSPQHHFKYFHFTLV
jgi:hypothetical protein